MNFNEALFTVKNVDQSTREAIKKRLPLYLGVGFALFLISILLMFLTSGYLSNNTVITPFLILPLLWFIGFYKYQKEKIEKQFMKNFAQVVGFEYLNSGNIESVHSPLFGLGNTKEIENVIKGNIGGYQISFFNYNFTVDAGKNSYNFKFTVCEIILKGVVPDLTIESRGSFDFLTFKTLHQKSLPAPLEFEKYFSSYVSEHLNIESLEILTPEVMTYLIDEARGYDLQFYGDRLYVFYPAYLNRVDKLKKLYSIAIYILEKLTPRLERLHDDVQNVNKAFKV